MTMTASAPPAARAARMEAVLRARFAPARLDIQDDSASHAGHAGAHAAGETHYTVTLVCESFTGVSRVERSRMVHAALDQEFANGLHALCLILRSTIELKS
jgi:BolA protein